MPRFDQSDGIQLRINDPLLNCGGLTTDRPGVEQGNSQVFHWRTSTEIMQNRDSVAPRQLIDVSVNTISDDSGYFPGLAVVDNRRHSESSKCMVVMTGPTAVPT